MDVRGPTVTLVINDVDMVNDIYITKNKFVEKEPRFRDIFYELYGEGFAFRKTDAEWAHRRRMLSAAFYKDKLTLMLRHCINCTMK